VYANHSELEDLGRADSLLVGRAGWILEGQPVPVVVGYHVRNPDEVAEPDIDTHHVYGPNLPPLTIGLNTSVGLPGGFRLDARAEYMGGHYIYDNTANYLARYNRYPVCEGAYAALAANDEGRLTAWERVWCVAENVPEDLGPIYPADFIRLRDVTLTAPLPVGILGGSATVSVSARNAWTWLNDDFLLFDPEMAGPEGMHSRVRIIDAHLPIPATFAVSLRVVR
jgi:hypothetical protein